MNLFYVKNATPANSRKVYSRDGSVAGDAAKLATTLTFNASGVLTGGDDIKITTGTVPGATPATFDMSFANSMQQNTGANNIVATSQNGYKPGDLVSYQINDDGTVVGNYSNEQTGAGPDRAGKLRQQRRPEIRRGQRLVCHAVFRCCPAGYCGFR